MTKRRVVSDRPERRHALNRIDRALGDRLNTGLGATVGLLDLPAALLPGFVGADAQGRFEVVDGGIELVGGHVAILSRDKTRHYI
jgi:hypothetical protein